MTGPIPTRLGDVLIVGTGNTRGLQMVGLIMRDEQQGLLGQAIVQCVTDHGAAVDAALDMVIPGQKIYFMNLDRGEWCEVYGVIDALH